MATAILCESRV